MSGFTDSRLCLFVADLRLHLTTLNADALKLILKQLASRLWKVEKVICSYHFLKNKKRQQL